MIYFVKLDESCLFLLGKELKNFQSKVKIDFNVLFITIKKFITRKISNIFSFYLSFVFFFNLIKFFKIIFPLLMSYQDGWNYPKKYKYKFANFEKSYQDSATKCGNQYEFFCSNHESLSDSKSPKVSRTFLSILADLNNVAIWMVFTCPHIFNSSSFWTCLLMTVPSALITIGINVTFMFNNFFSSQARF